MVCRECNKTIAKNSNYCKYCGTKVEKTVITGSGEVQKDLLYKVIEVTKKEADEGVERVIDFNGAAEPMHIFFPKLFCTGQLFMVKKYKFLSAEGKRYKRNILIKVNIA